MRQRQPASAPPPTAGGAPARAPPCASSARSAQHHREQRQISMFVQFMKAHAHGSPPSPQSCPPQNPAGAPEGYLRGLQLRAHAPSVGIALVRDSHCHITVSRLLLRSSTAHTPRGLSEQQRRTGQTSGVVCRRGAVGWPPSRGVPPSARPHCAMCAHLVKGRRLLLWPREQGVHERVQPRRLRHVATAAGQLGRGVASFLRRGDGRDGHGLPPAQPPACGPRRWHLVAHGTLPAAATRSCTLRRLPQVMSERPADLGIGLRSDGRPPPTPQGFFGRADAAADSAGHTHAHTDTHAHLHTRTPSVMKAPRIATLTGAQHVRAGSRRSRTRSRAPAGGHTVLAPVATRVLAPCVCDLTFALLPTGVAVGSVTEGPCSRKGPGSCPGTRMRRESPVLAITAVRSPPHPISLVQARRQRKGPWAPLWTQARSVRPVKSRSSRIAAMCSTVTVTPVYTASLTPLGADAKP